MSRVSAGADVDAYCSRCAMDLAHVVIAMDGARIAKVECKTCHNVHAYRDKSAKSAPRKSTRTTSGTRTGSSRPSAAERDYHSSIAGHDLSRARAYSPREHFGEGDILRHASFGIGIVARELADNKIQVLFPDASRVLVHGR